MSRRKKAQKELAALDTYEVPKEVENLDDGLVLSKPLLVKIIKDMIRGERERYKRYVLDVSSLRAKVELMDVRVAMLAHKGTKNAPKIEEEKAETVRVDRMDDELTGLNERVNELDDTVDTIISAYNCMQDYPKHSSFKTIVRDKFEFDDDDADDSSSDSPPDGLVNCACCSHREDSFSKSGYRYDSLYGRCCHKESSWYKQFVSGERHCSYFYAAIKNTSGTIHTGCSSIVKVVPLRYTPTPTFFGFDLKTLEKEEFTWQKE